MPKSEKKLPSIHADEILRAWISCNHFTSA
jgi:hypothetical protein